MKYKYFKIDAIVLRFFLIFMLKCTQILKCLEKHICYQKEKKGYKKNI